MVDDNIVELTGSEVTPAGMVSRLARHVDDIKDITVIVEWRTGGCAVYTCDGDYKDLVYHEKVLELDIARRLSEHWKTLEHPVDKPQPPG